MAFFCSLPLVVKHHILRISVSNAHRPISRQQLFSVNKEWRIITARYIFGKILWIHNGTNPFKVNDFWAKDLVTNDMKPTPYLAVAANTTQYVRELYLYINDDELTLNLDEFINIFAKNMWHRVVDINIQCYYAFPIGRRHRWQDDTDESGDNEYDEDEQRDMLAVDRMVDGMVGYMPNVRTVKLMPRRASDESIGYLGAKLVNSYAEQLDSLTSTVDIFATRLMPTLNLTNLQTLVLNKLYAECFWNHFVDDINQQNYSDILCFHRMQTLDLTFGPPGISLPTPNNTNMLHCDKTLFPVLQYLGIASCPDYLSAGIFHHAEFSTNLHTITVIDSIPLLALIRPGIDISTIKTLQIVVNKPVDPELFFQTMDLYLNDNCTYDLCKLCIYKVGFDIAPGLAHWAALTWLYIDCVHFVTLVELMQRMQRLKTVDARVVAFDRPDSPGLADEFDPFDYPRLLPETPLCPDLETLRLDRFGPTIPLIAIVACVKSLVDRLPVLKAFVTADHGVSSFINPKQEMHT